MFVFYKIDNPVFELIENSWQKQCIGRLQNKQRDSKTIRTNIKRAWSPTGYYDFNLKAPVTLVHHIVSLILLTDALELIEKNYCSMPLS